jgi:hypothetical protein
MVPIRRVVRAAGAVLVLVGVVAFVSGPPGPDPAGPVRGVAPVPDVAIGEPTSMLARSPVSPASPVVPRRAAAGHRAFAGAVLLVAAVLAVAAGVAAASSHRGRLDAVAGRGPHRSAGPGQLRRRAPPPVG